MIKELLILATFANCSTFKPLEADLATEKHELPGNPRFVIGPVASSNTFKFSDDSTAAETRKTSNDSTVPEISSAGQPLITAGAQEIAAKSEVTWWNIMFYTVGLIFIVGLIVAGLSLQACRGKTSGYCDQINRLRLDPSNSTNSKNPFILTSYYNRQPYRRHYFNATHAYRQLHNWDPYNGTISHRTRFLNSRMPPLNRSRLNWYLRHRGALHKEITNSSRVSEASPLNGNKSLNTAPSLDDDRSTRGALQNSHIFRHSNGRVARQVSHRVVRNYLIEMVLPEANAALTLDIRKHDSAIKENNLSPLHAIPETVAKFAKEAVKDVPSRDFEFSVIYFYDLAKQNIKRYRVFSDGTNFYSEIDNSLESFSNRQFSGDSQFHKIETDNYTGYCADAVIASGSVCLLMDPFYPPKYDVPGVTYKPSDRTFLITMKDRQN